MGDKILGMYVTKVLMDIQKEASTAQSLTRQISITVSNAFLADQAKYLLPQFHEQSNAFKSMNDWKIATILEAAVAEVYEQSSDAVRDLASYLVHTSSPDSENICPKVQVLRIGGVVWSREVLGADNVRKFVSHAFLNDAYISGHGDSKEQAESTACLRLLHILDADAPGRCQFSLIPESYDEWQPIDRLTILKPKDETLQEWWFRGAFKPNSAFHRAMATPLVFDGILAVDSWTKRQKDGKDICSVLMVITTTKHSVAIPIETADSATKARKYVGLRANQYISEKIQLQVLATLLQCNLV